MTKNWQLDVKGVCEFVTKNQPNLVVQGVSGMKHDAEMPSFSPICVPKASRHALQVEKKHIWWEENPWVSLQAQIWLLPPWLVIGVPKTLDEPL